MNVVERKAPPLARNVSRLGHIDLAGAGQVTVSGTHAYVGHIPNKDHLGTSIIDISDPRNPRMVATVTLDDHDSHGEDLFLPSFSTPLTRIITRIVLPLAFLVALAHLFYGGDGPGDGFTAGVVSGLGVAVFGPRLPGDNAPKAPASR